MVSLRSIVILICLFVVGFSFYYCSSASVVTTPNAYEKSIVEYRKQKDRFFRSSKDSPLPKEELTSFRELHYYAPDSTYRVGAKLERIKDSSQVELSTSQNSTKKYWRYGMLYFQIEHTECSLLLLRNVEDDTDFFVPFADMTSGNETYGSGRYLNIAMKGDETFVFIDFNQAYNPYCAYNEAYNCPRPPEENFLKVSIKAGEKNYKE